MGGLGLIADTAQQALWDELREEAIEAGNELSERIVALDEELRPMVSEQAWRKCMEIDNLALEREIVVTEEALRIGLRLGASGQTLAAWVLEEALAAAHPSGGQQAQEGGDAGRSLCTEGREPKRRWGSK